MIAFVNFFVVLAFAAASAPSKNNILHDVASPQLPTTRKLSGEVIPTSYTLEFRLHADFVETNTFTGIATIAITVGDLTTKDSSFQFHAKDLTFISTTLSQKEEISAKFSEPDPETDLVTVIPDVKLEAGTYTLVFEYTGLLNDVSMVGVYKSSYIDDFKQKKYVVATQFKKNYARRAFPCFDEPEMKAKFTVSISYPSGYHVWGNVQTTEPKLDKDYPDLEMVKFTMLNKMSTYLVAFLVADFNCKNGDVFNNKVTNLCSEINAMDHSAETALDAAPRLLEIMSEYTGFNYSLSKLTLAAIPDLAPVAMENWGLITFRESVLLWYENESSNYNKQIVVTILAHEISHQWFGDYVTLDWWSNLFLNEGFATYFEYHAADIIQPEWQLPKQFVIEQLQSALKADSFATSLPLSYNPDNVDFSSNTNDLSNNKGASILRMVQHFLGLENFKSAIVDYIANNALSTVTPQSLWDALQPHSEDLPENQRPPKNIATIMETWLTKTGYPLLTVSANGEDAVVRQEKFSLTEDSDDTKWYIPVTYSTSVDESSDTSTRVWMTLDQNLILPGVLTNGASIVLNNQQVGFYRVDYEAALLQKIYALLKTKISSIDEIGRAGLIDDQMNLARAGKKSYIEALDFVTFLEEDDSYYSWYAAFNGLNYLLIRTVREDQRNYFVRYIRKQMEAVNKVVSFDEKPEDHLYTLRQVLVLTWRCKIGDDDCVTPAVAQFKAYQMDETKKPTPNVRSIVYCYGLHNSADVASDFDFLWKKYQETRIFTEKVILLQALGCASDSSVNKRYLSMALTEDTIRRQDANYVFSSVYNNGPQRVTDVLDFIVDQHQDITNHFGSVNTVISLIKEVADLITTQSQIDMLTQFSQVEDLDSTIKTAATNAAQVGAQNLEEIQKIEDTFAPFVPTESSVPTGSSDTIEPSVSTTDPSSYYSWRLYSELDFYSNRICIL